MESQLGTFILVAPKGRSYEKKGKYQPLNNCHSTSSEGQKREITSTLEPQKNTIKRRENPGRRDRIFQRKNTITEPLELYKIYEKQRNVSRYSKKQPLQHILRFKRIQTLQDLEARIAIKVCNFLACLNIVSCLSEHTVNMIQEN